MLTFEGQQFSGAANVVEKLVVSIFLSVYCCKSGKKINFFFCVFV